MDKLISAYITLITLLSCSFSTDMRDRQPSGYWTVDPNIELECKTYYIQKSKLRKNQHGYFFNEPGQVTIRMNAAGCAIVDEKGDTHTLLSDVKGKYERIGENLYLLTYESFMGVHKDVVYFDGQKMYLRH